MLSSVMTTLKFYPPQDDFPIAGVHVPLIDSNLTSTIQRCLDWNIGGIQIFISPPSSWEPPKFSIKDIESARKLLVQNDFFLVIHATYLYNLHGAKDPKDEKYETNYERTIHNLSIDLDIAVAMDVGMVVHVNSATPSIDVCSKRIAKCINEALTRQSMYTHDVAQMLGVDKSEIKKRRKIVLENSAGEGTKRGKNLHELKTIMQSVREDLRSQVYVCIDTCHLFAAGDYNISKAKEVKRFFTDFDREIGADRLHVVHLNDSLTPFGSHTDRHANICCGYVWSRVVIEGELPLLKDDGCETSQRGKKCLVCGVPSKMGRSCNECKKWVCEKCGLSQKHYPCPKVKREYSFVQDLDHFLALQTFVNECVKRKVPMILEVPIGAKQDLEYVYNIDMIVRMLSLVRKGDTPISTLSPRTMTEFTEKFCDGLVI